MKEVKIDGCFGTTYVAKVVKGKSISVSRDGGEEKNFNLGDLAEYDSYNLSYYGYITSITEKTVTIMCRHDKAKYDRGEKVKKKRLDLHTFAWRNHNFNVQQIAISNADTMQYI